MRAACALSFDAHQPLRESAHHVTDPTQRQMAGIAARHGLRGGSVVRTLAAGLLDSRHDRSDANCGHRRGRICRPGCRQGIEEGTRSRRPHRSQQPSRVPAASLSSRDVGVVAGSDCRAHPGRPAQTAQYHCSHGGGRRR